VENDLIPEQALKKFPVPEESAASVQLKNFRPTFATIVDSPDIMQMSA
jgi:hypothetical protein